MKIIVCIKQVPGTNKVSVDPVTGVLQRSGIESKINPYDLYAIETALKLRESCGGTITALTMGPPQAEEIIREAYSMGVDEGVLMTDRAFAGADVLATSYTLSQGVKAIGDYDVLVCGKQTTDGDTAQVGSEMSEYLGIPTAANVVEISDIADDSMTVKMDLPNSTQTMRIAFPCLISVEKNIFQPRLPSYLKRIDGKSKDIQMITLKNLEDKDTSKYGLNGSPTQVKRVFPPSSDKKRELWTGDGLSDRLFDKLTELKFTERREG